jgi:hypothetical protein
LFQPPYYPKTALAIGLNTRPDNPAPKITLIIFPDNHQQAFKNLCFIVGDNYIYNQQQQQQQFLGKIGIA